MSQKSTFAGGCSCGAVRYEFTVAREELMMFKCHCRDCQRVSGGPYAPVVYIPATAGRLTVVRGQVKHHFTPSEMAGQHKRGFCADCGSPIYSQREKVPEMMVLKVGTLDDPRDLKLVMNIWTNSARTWMHLDPAIEHHPENRPVKA